MKKFIMLIFAIGFMSVCLHAAISTPQGFTDNFDEAVKRAKAEEKLIYIVFSGSDWCGGCQGLERSLLSKSEFVDGVKDNWELVFIDVPKDKSRLSEHGLKHNGEVRGKFGVGKFPTVYLLSPNGEKIQNGDTGLGSTPAQVAERMNKFKVRYFKRQKLDRKIGKAKAGTKTRVLAIHEYLMGLSRDEQGREVEFMKEVLAADKKMNLGLRSKYFFFTDLQPIWRRVQTAAEYYMMSEEKDACRDKVKKELNQLEAKARALKTPKEFAADRKELVEAIRDAKKFL